MTEGFSVWIFWSAFGGTFAALMLSTVVGDCVQAWIFMVQTPKKRSKLQKDIASRSSHEIMERIFGKSIMKEVDALVDKNSKDAENKGDVSTMKE